MAAFPPKKGCPALDSNATSCMGDVQALHDGVRVGDQASPRHPAYEAMLQKLQATKGQLFALHEAHEMTVKHQAS